MFVAAVRMLRFVSDEVRSSYGLRFVESGVRKRKKFVYFSLTNLKVTNLRLVTDASTADESDRCKQRVSAISWVTIRCTNKWCTYNAILGKKVGTYIVWYINNEITVLKWNLRFLVGWAAISPKHKVPRSYKLYVRRYSTSNVAILVLRNFRYPIWRRFFPLRVIAATCGRGEKVVSARPRKAKN